MYADIDWQELELPDNVELFFTDMDDYKVVFALFKNERVNSV